MTTAELRVPGDVHAQLMADVTRGEEWAGYLVCGVTHFGEHEVLLAREWHPVPDHQRILGTGHGLTWHPDFDIEMLNRLQRSGLAAVVVHRHRGTRPRPSLTDRRTAESLMPFLSREAPGRRHAFVVVGDHAVSGFIYRDGVHTGELCHLRVTGSSLDDWQSEACPPPPEVADARHDRLVRGFGPAARARLRAARVGVVGVGGGGSHVVQQLAYLGVGGLVVVDGDFVEDTNLGRLVGALPSAVRRSLLDRILGRGRGDIGRPKVLVMERMARAIAPDIDIVALQERFPSARSLQALRSCDVLIACVDRLEVRDDLNRFAKRYLIPLIDVGIEITPAPDRPGEIEAITGRVTKVRADGPCLRCQGIVSDAKLRAERGGRPRGYAGPARIPDPAVITLNGIEASIATTEVLQLLSGFAAAAGPNCGWIYDGLTGVVEQVRKEPTGCAACLGERGLGDPLIIRMGSVA